LHNGHLSERTILRHLRYTINKDLKKFSNSDSFNTAPYSGVVDGSGAVTEEAALAQAQKDFDAQCAV